MQHDLLFLNHISTLAEEFSDESRCLQWAVRGAAVVSIIGSCEWLYLRKQFGNSGIYALEILRPRYASKNIKKGSVNMTLSLYAVLMLQILTSVALFLPNLSSPTQGALCAVVAACYLMLSLRGVDGFSGGDALAKVIFLASAIGFLSGSSVILKITVAFFAVQLLIAYSTPGWMRIFDLGWLSGKKITGVMRTESYGRNAVWAVLKSHTWFARFVSGSIAIWEACFVFYLFLPLPALLLALCVGVVFHCTNALVMGLNVFPWSFVATYPSLIWVSLYIRSFEF